MHAMILAAGLGKRMRPLTDTTPKPLLRVGGKPLLQYHLEALARAGIRDVVINHSVFGDRIEAAFGDGASFGVRIRYSGEGETPLETAGGIRRALPLLGDQPFIAVNADVWTEHDFARLPAQPAGLAHLVLVPNPEHNPAGDFVLGGGRVLSAGTSRYTYSGIAVFRPELFSGLPEGPLPLAPLLRSAMDRGEVSGELYGGRWFDAGTPERLKHLNAIL